MVSVFVLPLLEIDPEFLSMLPLADLLSLSLSLTYFKLCHYSPRSCKLSTGLLVYLTNSVHSFKRNICDTSELRVRLVPKNMLKPISNFVTDRSKAVLLLWVLLVICVSCLSASYCLSVSGSLVDTCCERIDFLALLCLIFFFMFLSLSHVSWVGCGTRLYGFQIFTFFITFIKKLSHKIITQPGSQKHIKVGDTKVYIQSVIGGNVIIIDVNLVVSSSHSVFTETGEIRVSKEKSKLRKCLKKEMSLWCIDKKKNNKKRLFSYFSMFLAGRLV